MASIGLRVNDSGLGGNLSLGDTLAKAIFGDPEAAAKAALMGAQMRAHDAYTTKLGADTNLVNVKTQEEQDLLNAQRGSAASTGDAMAAAVPLPVPVEAPRPDPGTFGNVGPQPGIVTPEAQALHDKTVAALKNLGPVIVRSGNSSQIIDALGKGAGYGGLVGGLENGAQADPARLRIAGGLYTGTAPSTTTVWNAGDTAGVDAAERAKPPAPILRDINGGLVHVDSTGTTATPVQGAEPGPRAPTTQMVNGRLYTLDPDGTWSPAAGVEPPKPPTQVVNGMLYSQNPDGTWSKAQGVDQPLPETKEFNGIVYNRNPDGSWSPAKGVAPPKGATQVVNGVLYSQNPDGTWSKAPGVDAPLPETKEFGGKIYTRNPDGSWSPAPGVDPPPPQITPVGKNDTPYIVNADGSISVPKGYQPPPRPDGVYGGQDSVGGRSLNFVSSLVERFSDPNALITPQDARDYALAYNEQWGPKRQEGKDASGRPILLTIAGTPPAGIPTPAQVAARAGIAASPAAPNPVASGGQPPPVPPSTAPASPSAGDPAATAEPIPGADAAPPPNGEQSKARSFASAAAQAEQTLGPMKPDDVPSAVQTYLATSSDPSLLMQLVQAAGTDPKTRLWAVNMLQFTNAVNRQYSGAAITDEEWRTARQLFIPLPGDDPATLARKREARLNAITTIADQGWSNDPRGRAEFAKTLGQPPGQPQTAVKPPNAPPEWDSLTDRGKALWLKAHGGGQ